MTAATTSATGGWPPLAWRAAHQQEIDALDVEAHPDVVRLAAAGINGRAWAPDERSAFTSALLAELAASHAPRGSPCSPASSVASSSPACGSSRACPARSGAGSSASPRPCRPAPSLCDATAAASSSKPATSTASAAATSSSSTPF
ncbi:hypothetical protein [Nannocystis pusilla]|uniref:hypothetical protein n=1 Tax=Nannocystis pusilla TaxID=889268 RepID=UPI003B82BE8A